MTAPTSFLYQWKRNGTAITGASTTTYQVGTADEGDTITCTVNGVNTAGSVPATSAATGVVATPSVSAPTLVTAPAITGTAAVNSTLTASSGTWTNSPTSYAYQWFVAGGSAITGATASTFVVQTAQEGSSLVVEVTATNTGGTSAGAFSASTATVPVPTGGSAPTNTAVPVITGSATVNSTLSSSTGSWTGSPTGYAYVWNRAGTAISGATTSTYQLVSADAGHSITVSVTATNGTGTSSPATSASLAIPSTSNLLTGDNATFAGSLGNWTLPDAYDDATVALSNSTLYTGTTNSAAVTCTTAGANVGLISGLVAVSALETVIGQFVIQPATTARSGHLELVWYSGTAGTGLADEVGVGGTANNTANYLSVSATTFTETAGAWTTVTSPSTAAPSGATLVCLQVFWEGCALNEVHYLAGANEILVPPATPPVNSVAPAITVAGGGTYTVGNTLQVSQGTWT